MNEQIIEGTVIPVKIHYLDENGIGTSYRTFWRIARRYQVHGNRETVLVRVHGSAVFAERYESTMWIVRWTK